MPPYWPSPVQISLYARSQSGGLWDGRSKTFKNGSITENSKFESVGLYNQKFANVTFFMFVT